MSIGAVAVACLAGAVGISACGGTANDPVARAAVAKAAKVTDHAPGMQERFSVKLSGAALNGQITVTGHGSFDHVRRAGSFSLAMHFGTIPLAVEELGTTAVRLKMIEDRKSVYVKVRPRSMAESAGLDSGKQWGKTNLAGVAALDGSSVSSLTGNSAFSDPESLIGYLPAASSVTKAGRASVAGVRTTRYRAQIQLDRVAATVPPAARPQVRKSIASFSKLGINALPVSVWVDRMHRIRRIAFMVDGSASGQSVTMTMHLDVPRYGRQPAPQLPPASQVAKLS